jgi:hypothetical protein
MVAAMMERCGASQPIALCCGANNNNNDNNNNNKHAYAGTSDYFTPLRALLVLQAPRHHCVAFITWCALLRTLLSLSL